MARVRAGKTEDERHVGHESVGQSKERRAESSPAYLAVLLKSCGSAHGESLLPRRLAFGVPVPADSVASEVHHDHAREQY